MAPNILTEHVLTIYSLYNIYPNDQVDKNHLRDQENTLVRILRPRATADEVRNVDF